LNRWENIVAIFKYPLFKEHLMTFTKREGLAQQISKLLAGEIVSGVYKPGDKLPTEIELANQLGVSRTILREALASLKQDGLIESRQGRGIIVKEPEERKAFRFSDVVDEISPKEANYLYEMRAILEAEAAGLAAKRLTSEDAEMIKQYRDEMAEAVRLHLSGDCAHENFNAAIAQASKNIFLIEFLSFLHARLRSLAKELRLSTMMDPERAVLVMKEHDTIFEAIMSGDSAKAREATLTHLRNAALRAGLEIYAP
jgi:GntR family transcriptional repressor for pyruvate dehydrogenase complex